MTIGAPPQNYAFAMSTDIARSWHVGPRAYADSGIILHPLQLTGAIPSAPAGNPGGSAPTGPFAGSHAVVMLQAFPHVFTINGRAPG